MRIGFNYYANCDKNKWHDDAVENTFSLAEVFREDVIE